MAVNVRILGSRENFSDIRVCHFFIRYLASVHRISPPLCDQQSIFSCCHAIESMVTTAYSQKERQHSLMREVHAACSDNILSREEFGWINDNERTAFWVWGFLYQATIEQLDIVNFVEPSGRSNIYYNKLNITSSPRNHQERIDIIIQIFDSFIVPQGNNKKYRLMDRLKKQWLRIYSKPLPVKWLPDNEKDVLWAWEALKKQQQSLRLRSYRSYPPVKSGLSITFTPQSHSERALAVRAALDLWDKEPDSKKLFLLNLNKAWNQRKLRESRTDKKALNTYLRNETKMRLDSLASDYGMRISDVLEKLINEHFNSIKKRHSGD